MLKEQVLIQDFRVILNS